MEQEAVIKLLTHYGTWGRDHKNDMPVSRVDKHKKKEGEKRKKERKGERGGKVSSHHYQPERLRRSKCTPWAHCMHYAAML